MFLGMFFGTPSEIAFLSVFRDYLEKNIKLDVFFQIVPKNSIKVQIVNYIAQHMLHFWLLVAHDFLAL